MADTKPELTAPMVHLNGTSHQQLRKQFDAAYDSLAATLGVLNQMWPNARDYYVQPGTFEKACAQHSERVKKVLEVQDSIKAEYDLMEDRIDGKFTNVEEKSA